MNNQDYALIAQVLMGYVWQWARGITRIPNWATYSVAGGLAAACYILITPDFGTQFATNWRGAVFGAISFYLASRGGAAVAKDAKAAPPTNSI
jgi:hypothetical protein